MSDLTLLGFPRSTFVQIVGLDLVHRGRLLQVTADYQNLANPPILPYYDRYARYPREPDYTSGWLLDDNCRGRQ